VTDNNTSHTRSKIHTSAVDNGSDKKTKKIADIIKEYCATPNAIGRPKDTTDAATREHSDSIEQATSKAVLELHEMKSKTKNNKTQVKKGSLKKIIASAKKKFCVPDSIIITTQTARQRLKRGRNNGHTGHKTPMEDVAPYLIELIKKLSDMRTPIITSQGVELVNSLIVRKLVETALKTWKSKYSHGYRRNSDIKLGKTYWKKFLKQNNHLIRAKKNIKFDSKRADWCNYLNMQEM
jgi:hypothetical protein